MFQNCRTLDILFERFQCTSLGPKVTFWVFCTPFRCSKASVWFRTTYFTSKTRVLGGFIPFRCRTRPIVKISIGCIKCTSLCLQNHFLFCRNEHAQSTILVQSSCFGWFHSISLPHLTRCKNRYRGTFNARVCASRTVSCFFCSKHALSTSISLKLM